MDRASQDTAIKSTKNRLSVERTFSSWVRLGTLLVAIGAVAGEQVIDLQPPTFWRGIGTLFVLTAIVIFLYSFWEFFVILRRIEFGGEEETEGMPVWLMGLISALMTIAATIILIVVLFL